MESNKIFTVRFVSLFLTNMAVFFVFYGLTTILPLYATGILGETDDRASLLTTVFLIAAIIVRPFCGKLLDIFGKKRLLVVGAIFYLLCTVLYIFVKPFAVLLMLRLLQGVSFSVVTTASGSLAADIVPAHRKGAGLGYYTMSSNLAIVLGPLVGIVLIEATSYNVLFMVMSVFMFIGALLAASLKTSDLPKPLHVDKSLKLGDLFEKKALPIAAVAACVAFSYASVLALLSLYAAQKDLLAESSYFYIVFAASMIIVRPLTGKVYDTMGAKFVIIPSFICFSIGLVLLANTNGAFLFMLAAIFIGAGYGTLTTSLQASAVQSVSRERSGYATATYFTMFDLGLAIGSFVLAAVAVQFSYLAVYYAAAVFVLLVLCIYMVTMNKKTNTSS